MFVGPLGLGVSHPRVGSHRDWTDPLEIAPWFPCIQLPMGSLVVPLKAFPSPGLGTPIKCNRPVSALQRNTPEQIRYKPNIDREK